ncbi:hypothetical protein H3C67_03470 [Candidatus Dojkabacteria bacterium]|uniref:Uncharacterized protein n=2 Tax=Candidatus Dojkabacteria TaxID=74243 RepID=A0A136KG57_9BACT|nr:MAG: hypothetical protein UZ20_WS6002000936 [candidate division WS6 bacterium OLB21]MBW7953823.1 hypothetical protein [Candidatus Dojkabacteria bacterium]
MSKNNQKDIINSTFNSKIPLIATIVLTIIGIGFILFALVLMFTDMLVVPEL